jgi:hypothetical protein
MNTTTKTAQFTPGPWVVDEDYEDEEQQAIGIVKEGHGYIAGIHILASSNNGEGFTSEDRANATLIAAAPAMYEALKFLTSEIDLSKLNVRKDFSLMNAHAGAIKVILQAEGKLL